MTTTPDDLDWVVLDRLTDEHTRDDTWQSLAHTDQDIHAVALMADHGWTPNRLRHTFGIGPGRMRRLTALIPHHEEDAATA